MGVPTSADVRSVVLAADRGHRSPDERPRAAPHERRVEKRILRPDRHEDAPVGFEPTHLRIAVHLTVNTNVSMTAVSQRYFPPFVILSPGQM